MTRVRTTTADDGRDEQRQRMTEGRQHRRQTDFARSVRRTATDDGWKTDDQPTDATDDGRKTGLKVRGITVPTQRVEASPWQEFTHKHRIILGFLMNG